MIQISFVENFFKGKKKRKKNLRTPYRYHAIIAKKNQSRTATYQWGPRTVLETNNSRSLLDHFWHRFYGDMRGPPQTFSLKPRLETTDKDGLKIHMCISICCICVCKCGVHYFVENLTLKSMINPGFLGWDSYRKLKNWLKNCFLIFN